jgi:hypothetical protein
VIDSLYRCGSVPSARALLIACANPFDISGLKAVVTSRHPDRPGRYAEKAPWHKNGQDNDHHAY